MKYAYYPGCTMKTSYPHVEKSILALAKHLGVNLQEIEDWNCCGAAEVVNISMEASLILPARVLSLASRISDKVLVPCTECLYNLKRTLITLEERPSLREKIVGALEKKGLKWKPVKIYHPIDMVIKDIGVEKIKEMGKERLKGLRVVPYYGCLLTRPWGDDHPLYPTSMDEIFEALGAEIVDYPLKTKCCGAALTASGDERGLSLTYHLLREAKRRKADVIVVPCTLCQFNLEVFQNRIKERWGEDVSIPVLYFTQLLGLALGLGEEELGVDKLLVPFKMPERRGGK